MAPLISDALNNALTLVSTYDAPALHTSSPSASKGSQWNTGHNICKPTNKVYSSNFEYLQNFISLEKTWVTHKV